MPSGIIVIDKPRGLTSRRVTDTVGRLLATKKVGHVGTLDPLASGVLAVAVGDGTRLIPFLEPSDKVYRAGVKLGTTTTTQDAEGEVVASGDWKAVTTEDVAAAVKKLVGEIMQVPPMHSAVKQDGVPLYLLARKGKTVERKPRRVMVRAISIEDLALPDLTIRVECGPGVYIRTLAHDLGQALGCGAHLSSLVRLKSGPFKIEQATALDRLTTQSAQERLIAPADCLPHLPVVVVDETQAADLRQGRTIPLAATFPPDVLIRLLHDGSLLALARTDQIESDSRARPVKVFGGTP